MAISTEKAYEILNLPLGASKDAIEQSYKKLAVKWHPEKYTSNKNMHDALKKFKSINIAYRKLIHNERDDKDITLHEMFEQYRQVFHNETNKKNKLLVGQIEINTIKNINANLNNTNINNNKNTTINNTTLLELNNNNNFINNKNLNSQLNNSNCNKNTKIKLINDKNNNNDEENYENQYQTLRTDEHLEQSLLNIKLKAQTLAIKGNELAKQNEFLKAIEKFSEAIKYDPNDQRLYGNRSYCYDKLNLYQEALNDAQKAISLEPRWAKGYFRKGRALYGLKFYKEAEEAYEKVLAIENIDDHELEEELYKVRSLQLQEMGFSKIQSENAIRSCSTVQTALESILMYNETDKSNESCSDIDNNELDYIENDSDNGDDNINNFSKKLQSNLPLSNMNISIITNTNNNSNNTNSLNNKLISLTTSSTNLKSKSNNSSSNSSTSETLTDRTSSISNNLSSLNITNNQTSTNTQQSTSVAASTSLWIGNVDPNVTEDMLFEIFSAYGQLSNVRCLPEKYCAFVNFKIKEDAHKAMQNLQGKNLEGQRILIKYPDNPNTALLGSLLAKSQCTNKPTNEKKIQDAKLKKRSEEIPKNVSTEQNGIKLSGPVNGNECYFWRTTGCLYGDKCHYEHLKKNKGIDKKPWHK